MIERFVATVDIRGALEGRESDVLDALGIPWREGKPHINCPYPDHADRNPSWRWDRYKARSYCTCHTGSHSAIDVLMHIEGIGFEAAKIRLTELLHCEELIREKGRASASVSQEIDADSLLNPPSDNRDDSLPSAYLAARLRIDITGVPAPITKMVGLRSLAYFDPPAEKGKPKLLGSWPCAVFETIAQDGRRHAHRIYLAADRSGKADLGTLPGGKARDPKKSARRRDSHTSTAGCVVAWGHPAFCAHLILAEGIETAAAVAFAFRVEIGKGELAVLSAISASGIEAFTPWPATRQVTIAADRDEGKDGRGHKRGERAARTFAIRNTSYAADDRADTDPQIHIQLALPGVAGSDVDWLDVHLADGPDGVRAGVLGATPFVPNIQEIKELESRSARRTELEIVNKTFPLPPMLMLRVEYRHTHSGEIWVHKFVGEKSDKQTGATTEIWLPVCSPITPSALLRMADVDDAYGVRVLVADMAGIARPVDFDRGDLPRLAASEIRSRLMRAGLRVANGGELMVIEILKEVRPQTEIIAVARTGWHHLTELFFVTPGGRVIGATAAIELVGRLSKTHAGTLAGWQEAVGAAVTAENCPHWVLGLSAGFAGVLTDLTGLETHGVNLSGPSSRGKTTAQQRPCRRGHHQGWRTMGC